MDADISLFDETARAELAAKLYDLLRAVESVPPQPVLILQDGAPKDFSCLPITQYGALRECRVLPSFSELLDGFYADRDRAERIRSKTQALRKTLTNAAAAAPAAQVAGCSARSWKRPMTASICAGMGDIVTANLLRHRGAGRHAVDADGFLRPGYAENRPHRAQSRHLAAAERGEVL